MTQPGATMGIYHLRSFDATGRMITAQRFFAPSDREAAVVARDMTKDSAASFEVWAGKDLGRRCVHIEPDKIPVSEAEIKAEWEQRTEHIRRQHADLNFRKLGALYTREFGPDPSMLGAAIADDRPSAVGASRHGSAPEPDQEADIEALILSCRAPAPTTREEDIELFRASHLGHAGARNRSRSEIGRRDLVDPQTVQSALKHRKPVRRRIMSALAMLATCGFVAWQYHFISSAGEVLARTVAVSPGKLVVLPGEIATSPVAAIRGTEAAILDTSSPNQISPALDIPDHGKVAPISSTDAANPDPSTPYAESSAVSTHIFGINGDGGSRVTLRATAVTWLEVKDGEISIFGRLLQPGDEYRLPERSGLIIRVGNAQGVEVLVDGKPLPASAQPSQRRRTVVNLDPRDLVARAASQ